MADPNRRYRLAAIALPLLFLAMSGLARATVIFVNTTSGGSVASKCSLKDAVQAANSHLAVNGCPAGNGIDEILFTVTGTIVISTPLTISDPILGITGRTIGGVVIQGNGSVRLIDHEGTNLNLTNLTFTNGSAIQGGAIFANGSQLQAINCTFSNNTALPSPVAGGNGGAIFGNSAGTINILNSTFANNTAMHKGDPTVHNSGVDSFGGAIYVDQSGSVTKIASSTFSGNSADVAALDVFTLPSIKSTILANNTGGNCSGTPVDAGFNISDDASCSFATGNSTNPLLDPLGLQNNGGPTKTIALQSISPAINMIPLINCTDQSSNPITTDQRLFPRPALGACDIGAYEFGALAPIALNSHTVQIARSPIVNTDKVNLSLNFTTNPDGDNDCDPDDDALHFGVDVTLFAGSCANISTTGMDLFLSPFVVHTIGSSSYGTLFQSSPPKTVSAKIVTQTTPAGACGRWSLDVAVTGINSTSLGNGPFALAISDTLDSQGCFDIKDAIVGNQITAPSRPIIVIRR